MWICAKCVRSSVRYVYYISSMYTLKLPIKPHLRKFLITEYGSDPIRIDRESPLGILMHGFLCKSYTMPEKYDIPKAEIAMVIPKHVYELAGHSLKPYQVNMLNDFIDGMFRDILFAGIMMTQASFPTYRESHIKNEGRRSEANKRYYRRRYIIQYKKPQIKDVMQAGLQHYGITEDDIKMETLMKDYQRTMRRKLQNKSSSKVFHPPFTKPVTPSAQVRTLF